MSFFTKDLVENKPKPILDRLSDVETTAGFLLRENQGLKTNLAALVELLRAVIKAGGEGFDVKVQTIVAEEQRRQRNEAVERDRSIVNQLASAGAIVRADSVGDESLVVGREYTTDGQVTVERVTANFCEFPAEIRMGLKDQGVGFMLELPNGRFEITEIYNPGKQLTA